jgi:uncharacterized membrane protein YkoI
MASAWRQVGGGMIVGMSRAFVLALALLASPAAAGLDDMTRARSALEQGEVLPLATILGMVQAQIDARVIEGVFEEEDGQYIYEFELITQDGRLLEAVADAVTGEILSLGEVTED